MNNNKIMLCILFVFSQLQYIKSQIIDYLYYDNTITHLLVSNDTIWAKSSIALYLIKTDGKLIGTYTLLDGIYDFYPIKDHLGNVRLSSYNTLLEYKDNKFNIFPKENINKLKYSYQSQKTVYSTWENKNDVYYPGDLKISIPWHDDYILDDIWCKDGQCWAKENEKFLKFDGDNWVIIGDVNSFDAIIVGSKYKSPLIPHYRGIDHIENDSLKEIEIPNFLTNFHPYDSWMLDNFIIDKEESLWFFSGDKNDTLINYDGKNWEIINYNKNQFPQMGEFVSLAEDENGKIWIGTDKLQIVSYDKVAKEWKIIQLSNGKFPEFKFGVNEIKASNNDKSVWILANNEILQFKEDEILTKLKFVDFDSINKHFNQIKSFVVDKISNIWVLSNAGKVYKYSNKKWKLIKNLSNIVMIGIIDDGKTIAVVDSSGVLFKYSIYSDKLEFSNSGHKFNYKSSYYHRNEQIVQDSDSNIFVINDKNVMIIDKTNTKFNYELDYDNTFNFDFF